jgi:hypothetical protein
MTRPSKIGWRARLLVPSEAYALPPGSARLPVATAKQFIADCAIHHFVWAESRLFSGVQQSQHVYVGTTPAEWGRRQNAGNGPSLDKQGAMITVRGSVVSAGDVAWLPGE